MCAVRVPVCVFLNHLRCVLISIFASVQKTWETSKCIYEVLGITDVLRAFLILMDDFIVILYFELYDPGPESPDLKRDDRSFE